MWASIHAPQAVKLEYASFRVILQGVGTAQKIVSKMKLQTICPQFSDEIATSGKVKRMTRAQTALLTTKQDPMPYLTFPQASSEVLSIIAGYVESKMYPQDLIVNVVPSPSSRYPPYSVLTLSSNFTLGASAFCSTHLAV